MQEISPEQQKDQWKWPKLVLKVLVTAACLWYVSGKIDFTAVSEALGSASIPLLLLATLLFIFSKILSSFRLNIYFRNLAISLPETTNLRLYWLGMFYNLFLPGSIGGDAYKVIRLTKLFGIPYKKTTAAVLIDRVSGLTGLGLVLAGISLFVFRDAVIPSLLIAGALLSVYLLYVVTRKWFPYFLPAFRPTLLAGVLVQVIQVLCVCSIMAALGISPGNMEYILLFLVSSIVSILPLTIGGLGIRELVFLQGATYLGLQEEKAILISLLFYLVTLLTSAFGGWFVFRDPLKEMAKKKDSLLSP